MCDMQTGYVAALKLFMDRIETHRLRVPVVHKEHQAKQDDNVDRIIFNFEYM